MKSTLFPWEEVIPSQHSVSFATFSLFFFLPPSVFFFMQHSSPVLWIITCRPLALLSSLLCLSAAGRYVHALLCYLAPAAVSCFIFCSVCCGKFLLLQQWNSCKLRHIVWQSCQSEKKKKWLDSRQYCQVCHVIKFDVTNAEIIEQDKVILSY